jgi:hypothetical protein
MEDAMKYRSLDDMMRVADIAHVGKAKLSRRERLERWADLLMQDPGRHLRPLYRLEFMPAQDRLNMRGDDTPLAVAYQDPILRGEGLAGDRVGDAMAFFDLSSRDIHYLVCDCYYQGAMSASLASAHIRSIANRLTLRELWASLCSRFTTGACRA